MCWAFSRRTTPIARPFLALGGQLEIATISVNIGSIGNQKAARVARGGANCHSLYVTRRLQSEPAGGAIR